MLAAANGGNRKTWQLLLPTFKFGSNIKTLKKELASIGDQYADRHGYINYRDADEFEYDMGDFIRRQTQTLLGRGEPLLALQMGLHALREFADYETEEGCAYVDDAMDAMLTDNFL